MLFLFVSAPNIFVKKLTGHTDGVWAMALNDNVLLSRSAASTIRVWNPFDQDDSTHSSFAKSCLNEDKGDHRPPAAISLGLCFCLTTGFNLVLFGLYFAEQGVPTSIDFVNNDKSRFITSFSSGHHAIYDLETSKIISKLDFSDQQQSE